MTYRTANLQNFILYIYSTNIGTEYFKHGVYSPFLFSLKCSLFHNSNSFGSCIIHILYTECAKIKKNNSGAKRLNPLRTMSPVFTSGNKQTNKQFCHYGNSVFSNFYICRRKISHLVLILSLGLRRKLYYTVWLVFFFFCFLCVLFIVL